MEPTGYPELDDDRPAARPGARARRPASSRPRRSPCSAGRPGRSPRCSSAWPSCRSRSGSATARWSTSSRVSSRRRFAERREAVAAERRRQEDAGRGPHHARPRPLGRGRASGDPGRGRDRRDLPRHRVHRGRGPRGRDRLVQLPRAQLPGRPSGDGHARHALPRRAAGRGGAVGPAPAPHPHLAGADPDPARLAAAGAGGDSGHGLPQRRRSTPRTRRRSARSRAWRWTRGSRSWISRPR